MSNTMENLCIDSRKRVREKDDDGEIESKRQARPSTSRETTRPLKRRQREATPDELKTHQGKYLKALHAAILLASISLSQVERIQDAMYSEEPSLTQAFMNEVEDGDQDYRERFTTYMLAAVILEKDLAFLKDDQECKNVFESDELTSRDHRQHLIQVMATLILKERAPSVKPMSQEGPSKSYLRRMKAQHDIEGHDLLTYERIAQCNLIGELALILQLNDLASVTEYADDKEIQEDLDQAAKDAMGRLEDDEEPEHTKKACHSHIDISLWGLGVGDKKENESDSNSFELERKKQSKKRLRAAKVDEDLWTLGNDRKENALRTSSLMQRLLARCRALVSAQNQNLEPKYAHRRTRQPCMQ